MGSKRLVAASFVLPLLCACAGRVEGGPRGDEIASPLTSASYPLRISTSPSRGGSQLLNGASLSGSVYVFTSDAAGDAYLSGLQSVAFSLDGALEREASGPIFDFVGTAADETALPWDTNSLSAGTHSLTEVVTPQTGAGIAVTATFTVTGGNTGGGSGGGGGGGPSPLGCYTDAANRDLPNMAQSGTVTVEGCIAACNALGDAYAGVQYGSQCFCGNSYGAYGPATDCNMSCTGDSTETCGGFWANDVYATGASGPCVPRCDGNSCGSDGCGGSCGTCSSGTCSNGQCVTTAGCSDNCVTVDASEVHQRIDGFGACSTVFATTLSASQADLFFSPDNGVGLSLLRVRIYPDGSTDSVNTALQAQARGASVWATPFTPPGPWKDNNSQNGGSLLASHYDDWANRLGDFVQSMSSSGVNVLAVSVQNEPDIAADYDSCVFSGSQIQSFVRDNLGPVFSARGLSAKIMLPEVSNWSILQDYGDPTLTDPNAAPYVGIVNTHEYGGSPFWYSSAKDRSLPIWETEVSDHSGFDPTMASGLQYAQQVSDDLTIAEVSAWHYWLLIGQSGSDDNQGLVQNDAYGGQVAKRLYTLGNFSKFVRPGYERIGATGAPGGVSVTAYRDPSSGKFAIVAINQNGAPSSFTLSLNGLSASSVTPWVTSESLDLAAGTSIGVSSGLFPVTLDARSVTTFVGGS